MALLITGAAGFIGSYFCKYELECSVHQLESNIKINSSCGSNSVLKNELNNCSVILHLACLAHSNYSAQELDEVNHLGTLALATAAAKAGVKRFVFVSTVNVHGGVSVKPFTENSNLDDSINTSKVKAENGLKIIGAQTGMEITIIRPVLVYGKGAPGNMALLIRMASKLPFTPFGLVKNKRSFISVSNLCSFISVCVTHPKAANETFLVSDGYTVSTPVLMSAMALGMGKYIYHIPVPIWMLKFAAKLLGKSKQIGQILGDFEVETSKSQEVLGWSPPETMAQAMVKLK